MKRTVYFIAIAYAVLMISWIACTPSSGQRYGTATTPTVVPIAGLYGPDSGIGGLIVFGDAGAYVTTAPANLGLPLAGDIIGTSGVNVAKQAAGSDGGFTVNAAFLGHLSAVGNGKLEGVGKCSAAGTTCTITFPIPSNTSGKVVVEVSGLTGDGGVAAATQTWTGYVYNHAGTCHAFGLALAGGTLYATDAGAAGAWTMTTALTSCGIVTTGTGGTATVDWSATASYYTSH